MKIAVFGHPGYGGVRLRGIRLAADLDATFVPLPLTDDPPTCDVGIIVKYVWGDALRIRDACRWLIYDPLDNWHQEDVDPYERWRKEVGHLRPDVLIATSPACEAVMRLGCRYSGCGLAIRVLPHQPDRELPKWQRDSDAPVVYVGDRQYIHGHELTIIDACRKAGREVQWVEDPHAYLSACLLLHPRLGRSATAINRLCKPQIKLANAAQFGLPVLATDDPAVMTLAQNVTTLPVGEWSDVDALASAIDQAVSAEAVDFELSQDRHAEAMLQLVGEF